MNKSIFYIGIVTLMFPVLAEAQQETDYDGKVNITPKELVQRGDSLYVSMSINLNEASVETQRSMDIIPVLTNGVQEKDLPMVSIHGKRKHKEYIRQMALMSEKERSAYVAPYTIEKSYGKSDRILDYKYVMAFEPWMKDAWLDAKTDLCGCGIVSQFDVKRLVDNVSLEERAAYEFQPALAYVPAKMEKTEIENDGMKQRAMQEESFLDFVVSKTDIRPEFGNNPRELARIRSMIEDIRDDRGVTLRNIDITGYASPEGTLALNKRLSEGRARALQSYLQSHYDIPAKAYTVNFGGEDWDGLVKLLIGSDLADKQEVLDIIENYPIENGREKKIMDLANGRTYHYMLKEMFPSLRRVVCKVDYDVKPFNVEEAKEVIMTRPQNLSLNEMYAVANAYEEGAQEFCDVFEIAVRMFPEDETANLNAAIAALSRKDGMLAKRYLDKIQSTIHTQQYDNAMGVMYMLKGDYKKAADYLETAAAAGLSAAKANLKQMQDNGLMDMKK